MIVTLLLAFAVIAAVNFPPRWNQILATGLALLAIFAAAIHW